MVLQTAGGTVVPTEEESRAHLEQSCAAVLKGAAITSDVFFLLFFFLLRLRIAQSLNSVVKNIYIIIRCNENTFSAFANKNY